MISKITLFFQWYSTSTKFSIREISPLYCTIVKNKLYNLIFYDFNFDDDYGSLGRNDTKNGVKIIRGQLLSEKMRFEIPNFTHIFFNFSVIMT